MIDRNTDAASPATDAALTAERPFRVLSLEQAHTIDEALASIGPFGELRLVVSRGRLRFMNILTSQDMQVGR